MQFTIVRAVEVWDKAAKAYLPGTHESKQDRDSGSMYYAWRARGADGAEFKLWAPCATLTDGQQYDTEVRVVPTANKPMHFADALTGDAQASAKPSASNIKPPATLTKHYSPQVFIEAATWIALEVSKQLSDESGKLLVETTTVNTVLQQLEKRGVIEAVVENMANEPTPF